MSGHDFLGIHDQALLLRARRADVLATNLANADTPKFKARDFEFSAALARSQAADEWLTRTHANHFAPSSTDTANLAYRVPFQPTRDGNTVEADLELARFAENAVAYQVSLLFVNSKISNLRTAITGGR